MVGPLERDLSLYAPNPSFSKSVHCTMRPSPSSSQRPRIRLSSWGSHGYNTTNLRSPDRTERFCNGSHLAYNIVSISLSAQLLLQPWIALKSPLLPTFLSVTRYIWSSPARVKPMGSLLIILMIVPWSFFLAPCLLAAKSTFSPSQSKRLWRIMCRSLYNRGTSIHVTCICWIFLHGEKGMGPQAMHQLPWTELDHSEISIPLAFCSISHGTTSIHQAVHKSGPS